MTTNVTKVSVEDEMKADVYSYAIIIWEMMSRKIPWSNCNFYYHLFICFSIFYYYYFQFIFQ